MNDLPLVCCWSHDIVVLWRVALCLFSLSRSLRCVYFFLLLLFLLFLLLFISLVVGTVSTRKLFAVRCHSLEGLWRGCLFVSLRCFLAFLVFVCCYYCIHSFLIFIFNYFFIMRALSFQISYWCNTGRPNKYSIIIISFVVRIHFHLLLLFYREELLLQTMSISN